MTEPSPGEVWVLETATYTNPAGHLATIYLAVGTPVIVTFVTVSQIGYVQAGDGYAPNGGGFYGSRDGHLRRGDFDWSAQFARIWPPAEPGAIPTPAEDPHPEVLEAVPDPEPESRRFLGGRLGTR